MLFRIVKIGPMIGYQREAIIEGASKSRIHCLLVEKSGIFDVISNGAKAVLNTLSYFSKDKPLNRLSIGDTIRQHFVDQTGKSLHMRGFRKEAAEYIYRLQPLKEHCPCALSTIYRQLRWEPFTCSYHFSGCADDYSFSLEDYLKDK